MVTLCRQLAEEIEGAHPGFRVELDLPEACPYECDPERIAQVVSNLLGNARHHGDPTRPATLALRCREHEVEIEIPAENRARELTHDTTNDRSSCRASVRMVDCGA
jgi:two-component system, chemotaxis family, sensor kinase Cph1